MICFPSEHLETLSTVASNITIAGNPRSRGTQNRWTISHTDRSLVLSDSTSGLGGGNTAGFYCDSYY